MIGIADIAPEYVAARTVLLEALGSQREAIIVVGAQAVYLRTGQGAVPAYAPYTTDADLPLEPSRLADQPLIEQLLSNANFKQRGDPGVWWKTVEIDSTPVDVEADLMVPERFAPTGGRRSVRLPPHHKMIARMATGLEGSILDHDLIQVSALHAADQRAFSIRVAGPAALIAPRCKRSGTGWPKTSRSHCGQGCRGRISAHARSTSARVPRAAAPTPRPPHRPPDLPRSN